MEREELKSAVESLLFVADGPQTLPRLAEALDQSDRDVLRQVLMELKSEYENQNRGIRLVEVAGGFQLRTAKTNAEWVKKFLGGRPARMSRYTGRGSCCRSGGGAQSSDAPPPPETPCFHFRE